MCAASALPTTSGNGSARRDLGVLGGTRYLPSGVVWNSTRTVRRRKSTSCTRSASYSATRRPSPAWVMTMVWRYLLSLCPPLATRMAQVSTAGAECRETKAAMGSATAAGPWRPRSGRHPRGRRPRTAETPRGWRLESQAGSVLPVTRTTTAGGVDGGFRSGRKLQLARGWRLVLELGSQV